MASPIDIDIRVRSGGKNISLRRLERKVQEARDQMADFSPIHQQISILLDRWVQLNFRSQGGNVGGWAPFKAGGRWVGRGDNRFFDTSAKLLQDTGRLRISFIPFASRNEAGIGSQLPYARAHHAGLRHLPARRLLPDEGEQNAEIERLYEHHVNTATGTIND